MKYFSFFLLSLLFVGAGCLGKEPNAVIEDDVNSPPVEIDEQVMNTSESGNVTLFAPTDSDVVTSPITVTGQARVFENVVNWRILDVNGTMLSQGYTMADAPDTGQFGTFEDRIFLPVIETDTFILQVFTYSAKDGSVQDLVEVELIPFDEGKTSVDVFFTDPAQIAAGGDCAEVDVEKRTFHKTVNVAELALEELVKGPTSDWAGTEVPSFTALKSIMIQQGVATADFTGSLESEWNGGSCHVVALQAQIEETLLQFPSISSVVITLDGGTDILEP